MAGIFPNVGAARMLEKALNAGNNITLKLYANNVTPAESDTAGVYTEVSGGGYASKTLTAGSWTVSGAADPATASYVAQVWTFSGAIASIYGYFMIDASSGVLIAAERFSDGPYAIPSGGGTLTLTPTITAD